MKHQLVYYGNETLRKTAAEISAVDGNIQSLIDEMFPIMYKNDGIGLAAPQVGVSLRLIVVDTKEKDGSPFVLINPVITDHSSKTVDYEEGCLSLPGIFSTVSRPDKVTVTALDREGKETVIEAKGLLARVFQHEIDHLDGHLFIDRIDPDERNEFRHALKKIKKLSKAVSQ